MTTAHTAHLEAANPASPPPGWEREVPKYRVIRETKPSPKPRFRSEPPFASSSELDVWQYGDRILKAGEIIETREWPHPMFFPLNYAAKKVLEFFNSRQKSRMGRSPYATAGQLQLDDGLIGTMPRIASPQPERVNPRSAA